MRKILILLLGVIIIFFTVDQEKLKNLTSEISIRDFIGSFKKEIFKNNIKIKEIIVLNTTNLREKKILEAFEVDWNQNIFEVDLQNIKEKLLNIKEKVRGALSNVGDHGGTVKQDEDDWSGNNQTVYNTGMNLRYELLQELSRRTMQKKAHIVVESLQMVQTMKLKVLEDNEKRRQQMIVAQQAATREVVTVVGGGKARAQFHISMDVDFESLLDDVCVLWGDLESSEYRLVGNYALSVDYFDYFYFHYHRVPHYL